MTGFNNVKIHHQDGNSLALFWYKEIKNWFNYQDFRVVIVNMHKNANMEEPVT